MMTVVWRLERVLRLLKSLVEVGVLSGGIVFV